MIVSLIAAIDRRRGIGIGNRLPWHLPADQRRFRELTMGHHIIVGRRTFESIGRALPGRHTIIVTRTENYRCPPAAVSQLKAGSCTVVQSLEEAIELAKSRGETDVFVCGGAEIYRQALSIADRLYLTFVEAEVEADTFFPAWDDAEWEVRESAYQAADERNQYSFLFKVFKKRKAPRDKC